MTDRAAPPPSDPEQGIWRGRSVARRFVSPDGLTVLVGRSAADNDLLTFGLGESRDAWLHVAAESGSHVIVRNPDGLERLPATPCASPRRWPRATPRPSTEDASPSTWPPAPT
jgi:hypothetical protein